MTAAQCLSSSVALLFPARPLHRHRRRIALSHISDFGFSKKLTLDSSHKISRRSRTSSSRINCDDSKDSSPSSAFLDENGVVEDMNGYLNYLSLEYDSVWDTKPYWCQPWTITLTGTVIISLSWLILHSAVATGVVMAVIGAWWYIFLYDYPKAYSDMIQERRKRVTNGLEDTYGANKNQ